MRLSLFLLLLLSFSFIKSYSNKDSLEYINLSEQLPKIAAINHDSATQLAFKGLQIAQKTGIPKLIASANINYGIMMKIRSELDSALYYYYEARSTAEKAKDTQMILGIEINLSNLYSLLKEDQKAISSLENALNLANATENEDPLPFIYNNLGMIFSKNENYDQATDYYLQAIKLNEKVSDSVNLAKNFSNYAELLKSTKKFEKSYHYFQKALLINRRIGNLSGISFNYKGMGELRFAQKQYSEALFAFEKSSLYADSSGSSSGKLDALKNLHSVNAALGNWKPAYSYLNQLKKLEEELEIGEKTKTIAGMEKKYKNKEQQAKINLLESERMIQYLQISKNQKLNYLLLFILAFLIALLIIFFQRSRNLRQSAKLKQDILLSKIKTQELLSISAILKSREDERRKISYNLHDTIGVMLATAKLYLTKGLNDLKKDQLQMESFRKTVGLIDEASQEARRIAHELAAPVLEKFGLIPALRDLTSTINETGQIKVLFEHKDKIKLTSDQDVNLYRIIQELINNTIKHADAHNISIVFEDKDERLILNYKDDGIGLNEKSEKYLMNGLGWKSIYSRIQHLEGKIELMKNSKGLFIQFQVPKK